MKRIIVILSLTIMVGTVSAQIFGSSPVQNSADVTRVYLWDKPITDSITYRGILPGGMKVVTVFDALGKSYIALFDSLQYVQAQNYFTEKFMQDNIGRIIGYEYVVMYVGKFSWIKKSQLRKLKGMQRKTAEAFNEKEKFMVMSQAPRTVVGQRDDRGNILLAKQTTPKEDNTAQSNQQQFTPPPPSVEVKTTPVRTPATTTPSGFTPPVPPVKTKKYSFE